MHINVEQERNANGIAPCQPFGHGQDQQWHPGDERNCDDSPAQQLETAAGQAETPEELKEGTAQNERKVAHTLRSAASSLNVHRSPPDSGALARRVRC